MTPHDLSLLPSGTQVRMAGADWMSERDRKAQVKAEAARKKAALAAAKKLQEAADALSGFALACIYCADSSAPRRADDSRTLLAQNMREYAGYLESVYDR